MQFCHYPRPPPRTAYSLLLPCMHAPVTDHIPVSHPQAPLTIDPATPSHSLCLTVFTAAACPCLLLPYLARRYCLLLPLICSMLWPCGWSSLLQEVVGLSACPFLRRALTAFCWMPPVVPWWVGRRGGAESSSAAWLGGVTYLDQEDEGDADE